MTLFTCFSFSSCVIFSWIALGEDPESMLKKARAQLESQRLELVEAQQKAASLNDQVISLLDENNALEEKLKV